MPLIRLRTILGVIAITVAVTACQRTLERSYQIVVDGVSYTVNEYTLLTLGLEDSQTITEVVINGRSYSCEYINFDTDCARTVRTILAQNARSGEDAAGTRGVSEGSPGDDDPAPSAGPSTPEDYTIPEETFTPEETGGT